MKKKIENYSFWFNIIIAPFLVFFIILLFYPDSVKTSDLNDYISLITQVLSVLIGFSFVGITLHLSGYTVSDKISNLLADIKKISIKIKKNYLYGPPRKNKITCSKFISNLMIRVNIDQLEFYKTGDNSLTYFIYRPYWDGVWYQVLESPFFDENKSDEELFNIQCLHQVVICSAKIIGIIYELRENNINLIKSKSGSNGSIGFIESYEKIIKEFSSLKDGKVPDSLQLADSINLTLLAIDYSDHYMFEELSAYSEEVNWNPYKLTYFEVLINDYMLWLNYLIAHIQLLRLTSIDRKYKKLTSKFSKSTNKKIGLKKLSKLNQEIFILQKQSINLFGINKRYKEIKDESILGIGIGIVSLFLIVFLWPINLIISDPINIKYLFSILYTVGITAIGFSSMFVFKMLLGRDSKLRRSPLGNEDE